MCLLFLHGIREQGLEAGKELSRKGVKCLGERACLDAFVNEWTMVQMARIERLAEELSDQSLRGAIKHMILEAVNAYDGMGAIRFVDYSILVQSPEDDSQSRPTTPGSLFLLGFGERLARIPAKSIFSPRKKLFAHEQVEIMIAVSQSQIQPGFSLAATLEALRPKATAEIVFVA